MLKSFFNFSLYTLTALIACFFSLILVLHFFNPVFANTSNSDQEKITFKKVFSDIFSNLKLILKDLGSESEDSKKSDSNSNTPSPPPSSFEGSLEELEVPNNEDSTQQNSSNKLEEYGTPSGELSFQPTENAEAPSGELSFQPTGNAEAPSGELSFQPTENAEAPSGELSFQPTGNAEAPSGELSFQPTGNVEAPLKETGDTVSLKTPAEVDEPEDLPQSEISLQIQSDMAPFIYENAGLRSPFDDPTRTRDFTGEVVDSKGDVKIVIPKTPPEMYDLSEIKLKGIIWNIKNPKALFELPSGEGHYTLIKGDKIGKNGLIFEIREDEVVIVETFYKGYDTTERVIKIKKMDRLRLNEIK